MFTEEESEHSEEDVRWDDGQSFGGVDSGDGGEYIRTVQHLIP